MNTYHPPETVRPQISTFTAKNHTFIRTTWQHGPYTLTRLHARGDDRPTWRVSCSDDDLPRVIVNGAPPLANLSSITSRKMHRHDPEAARSHAHQILDAASAADAFATIITNDPLTKETA